MQRSALLPFFREYHRGSRGDYLRSSLSKYVDSGTILDVGAGTMAAKLRDAFGERYHAVDFAESYNGYDQTASYLTPCNLNLSTLPFADDAFDTVICLDVLEHLDDPHAMIREIQRVARKRVIISLPNNWVGYLKSFLTGTNITHRAGYGLPATPHAAGQRHKWFFNAEEAFDFVEGNVNSDFTVVEKRAVFTPGTDAFIFGWPVIGRPLRLAALAKRSTFVSRLGIAGVPVFAFARLSAGLAYALDVPIQIVAFAWRRPRALYNLLCRQIWVILERRE